MPEEVQRREAPSDTADAPSSLDPSVDDSSPDQEALPTLERMERHLAALHGAIDAHSRERAHREFSPARLAGAILEVMVGGLVVLALLDWLLQVAAVSILVKLAFAAVFQLAALTAFVLAPRDA